MKKLTSRIIWEMHGFSHQFPTAWENATKSIVWGKSGKLILILFPWYGCFFLIEWVLFFPLDSHPTVLFMTWEVNGFSHQFPIALEKTVKPIK